MGNASNWTRWIIKAGTQHPISKRARKEKQNPTKRQEKEKENRRRMHREVITEENPAAAFRYRTRLAMIDGWQLSSSLAYINSLWDPINRRDRFMDTVTISELRENLGRNFSSIFARNWIPINLNNQHSASQSFTYYSRIIFCKSFRKWRINIEN